MYALIGDIVNSRRLPDRQAVQDNLQAFLDAMNERFDDVIVSKLTITLGDEFQGVFKEIEPILMVIDLLDTKLMSMDKGQFSLRYGIGYGSLLTDVVRERSIGADGSVFWSARDAIQTVHDNNDGGNTNTCFLLPGNNHPVNAMARLLDGVRNNWTQTQAKFMHVVIDKGYDQVQPSHLIQTLSMTPQQVSNRLKAAWARQYLDGRKAQITLIREVEHD